MAFHFPLQAVLHLRQSIERQQELRLAAANQLVARAQHLIEQVEARRQELDSTRSRELSAGLTSAELGFAGQCDAELLRQRRMLEPQLARLEQLCGEQREIFRQARRERRCLKVCASGSSGFIKGKRRGASSGVWMIYFFCSGNTCAVVKLCRVEWIDLAQFRSWGITASPSAKTGFT